VRKKVTKLKGKLKNSKDTIIIPLEIFKKAKAPIPEFRKAAKKVMKGIREHFTKKGHGWDLGYSFLKEDIFETATGHHLENYLLRELANSKLPIEIVSEQNGLVVRKTKKGKK
jgi:hypothetical protein